MPEFVAWLDERRLSLDEAARLQPAYHAHLEAEWAPTVSSDDSGSSRFGSLALVAEYTRVVVTGRGGTNQLGAVLQWEPIGNSNDAQWYVLGGALASIETDERSGNGVGFELGVGFSFRRRTIPLIAEVVLQALPSADAPTVHGGLQLGVVF